MVKGKVVKVYSLTPKAKRTMLALLAFDKEYQRLEKFSDEEIEKISKDLQENPSLRSSELFLALLKELKNLIANGGI